MNLGQMCTVQPIAPSPHSSPHSAYGSSMLKSPEPALVPQFPAWTSALPRVENSTTSNSPLLLPLFSLSSSLFSYSSQLMNFHKREMQVLLGKAGGDALYPFLIARGWYSGVLEHLQLDTLWLLPEITDLLLRCVAVVIG